MDKLLQFLRELKENNNREWFNDNRKRYEESRDKTLFLTDVLINEIKRFDPDIAGVNPKECLFRIFKDVRFSKDKRPYKTNFGSFISKEGRKSIYPGYYFHIEPGQSFVGGGVYMPQSEQLRAIRNYMAEHGQEFLEIKNEPQFQKIFEMYDDQLKTAPKGFPKDHEFIEILRYKSFAFSSHFEDRKITGDDFVNHAVQAFKKLHKANVFLSDAFKNKTE